MEKSSKRIKIYQIFYDERSKEILDPGFIPLDNSKNERSDWAEYWPIRNFLLSNTLEDNTYYGFFSPKFSAKTKLASLDVLKIIHDCSVNADVITFSPPSYYSQVSWFLNVFEQAAFAHGSPAKTMQEFKDFFVYCGSNYDVENSVMTSREVVYSNYFIAKKSFWERWFSYGEMLFDLCEKSNNQLAQKIIKYVPHVSGDTPAKVFIMERLASYLLDSDPSLKVHYWNSLFKTNYFSGMSFFKNLYTLDSLKMSYKCTKAAGFLDGYFSLRNNVLAEYPNVLVTILGLDPRPL